MHIDSIKEGIVLDHITAGNAMTIYNLLGLDKLECTVAIIKNVPSKKVGKKDIIKIDSNFDVNLEVLGYVDPGTTIDIIHDSKLVEKKHVDLPDTLHGVIKCKNPRCITSVEREIIHEFKLTDPSKGVYRCIYCEHAAHR